MFSGQGAPNTAGVGPAAMGGASGDPVLTLAGVLSSYSSTPNPPMAALKEVISDRNALSSQNLLLWGLIDNQRSVHGQTLKELDRVRLERDRFKAKLTSLGENPNKILNEQETNEGSPPGTTLGSSFLHSGLRFDNQQKAVTLEEPTQMTARNQSEDSGMRCMQLLWSTPPDSCSFQRHGPPLLTIPLVWLSPSTLNP